MTNEERVNIWRQRLESQKNSGKNMTTWCKENAVNVKGFYRWSRIITDLKNDETESHHRFVLAKKGYDNIGSISINIGKATINVGIGFDSDILSSIVQMLCNIC